MVSKMAEKEEVFRLRKAWVCILGSRGRRKKRIERSPKQISGFIQKEKE